MDEDFLDALLDAAGETRLKLLTEDEARAVMMLLGALEDETRSEEVRRARRDALPPRIMPRSPSGLRPDAVVTTSPDAAWP
ncbi:hypothetical protein [Streptomyces sp. A1136]|uniref:hypothetical protein n=1 Tax=Streptomyces sp. A1136 TaxID=2563102 RepID=UPI001F10D586|nr:hypothetical protein [Streptomyces sp. A1136]